MADVTRDVGTRVVFENEVIRMWHFELEPGEETPMHKHENDYMWYSIKGAPLACTGEKGEDLGTIDSPTGFSINIKADGEELIVLDEDGEEKSRFPATHKARNAGHEKYVEILVEFKK